MKNPLKKLLFAAAFLFLTQSAYAQVGGGVTAPMLIKPCSTAGLCATTVYDELGTSSDRWDKVWATDLDVSGVFTFGGTMASSLDLDGYDLVMDTDGDTKFVNDRDVGIADDEIGVNLAGAADFLFLANTFRALSGSAIETNTINETTAASGVTADSVLLKDGAVSLPADSNQVVFDSDAAAGASTTLTDSATGARTLTLPDSTTTLLGVTSIDTSSELITIVGDETGSGALCFATAPTFPTTVTVGAAAGATGDLLFKGLTSGTVTMTVADAAGTYTMVLPADDGDAGEQLQSDGSGGLTWEASAPVPTVITVADTTDSTSYCALFESATGDLAPKTDAACLYDASNGTLSATTFSGALSGNATTATALAADPANCSAGSVAGGVTAAGVAEACLDPIVSTEIDASSEILAIVGDETGTGALVFANSPAFTTPNIGTATGSVSGNAGTATALAADPADCGANAFATTIAASGALTCASIADADVPNTITIDLSTLASTVTVVDSTDATSSIAMFDTATGSLAAKTDGGLTYDATSGTLAATVFSGPLTGNVTGNVSGTSGSTTGNAATVTFADAGGDTSTSVALGTAATGSLAPATDAELTYNATTNALTATTFVGALTGNADTATSCTNSTNVGVTDDTTTNATMYPTWVTAATGNLPAKVSSTKLSFNPSTGILTSTAFAGALTGNVTGNVSGSAGSTTGNAATATALAADPADCSATNFATSIAASGALTCSAIADADVPDTITINLAGTATALAADPADCGASAFATSIAASGALTCSAIQSGSTTVSGIAEAAIASEVTTGTDTARYVSPDALSGSDYGKRVVTLMVKDDSEACATGDGAGDVFWRVPSTLNGYNLVAVAAAVQTAGTTGTEDIQIANVTQAADMLSTKLTIDSAETDTLTAAAAAVIDTANDDVATGDRIRIDIDACNTTPANGTLVEMQFQLP